MKVSLEVELVVERNYLKNFVNSVEVICFRYCSTNTVETAGFVSQVAALKGREGGRALWTEVHTSKLVNTLVVLSKV